jgi:hypothetical protein
MLFNLLLYAFIATTTTNALHIPHHHVFTYISTTTTTTTTIITSNSPSTSTSAPASISTSPSTSTQQSATPTPSIYSPIPLYDPANRYKVFLCLLPNWSNCTKWGGTAGQCYNIAGNITGFDPYPEQLCRIYDVEECAATADEGSWNSMDVWFPGFDDINKLDWDGRERGVSSWRCVEPGKTPIP